MHNIRKVTEDIVWIGGNDRRLALFENVFPIPEGVSYNSYLLKDEKTVLLDTADSAIAGQFFENLEAALGGRTLDYVVINHMEPDHAALLADVLRRYPKAVLVGNAKTFTIVSGFFGLVMINSNAVLHIALCLLLSAALAWGGLMVLRKKAL